MVEVVKSLGKIMLPNALKLGRKKQESRSSDGGGSERISEK